MDILNNSYKFFIRIFLVTLLFTAMIYTSNLDLEKIKSFFIINFSLSSCLLVISLFILNFYVVAARLYLSYKQFNLNISYSAAKEALIAGQLGGIIPVFGSALSQAAKLNASSNISPISSSFVFFYERIIMAASGLFLSLIAAYYAFGNKYIVGMLKTNTLFVEYLIAITLTLVIVLWKGLSFKEKISLKTYLSTRNILYTFVELFLSICSWLLASCCFLICIYFAAQNYPSLQINYLHLLAISLIVSFAASMPFSVNGWGVRELAAITLFGLLSISKEMALFSSVSVGISSTIAILIFGCISYFTKNGLISYKLQTKTTSDLPTNRTNKIFNNITDQRIIYLLGYLVSILIFFHAYVSLGKFEININLADICAICGLVVILLYRNKFNSINFRIPHIFTFIYGSIIAFAISFLVGYLKFGFSSFAFFSKFIGFFILVGYFAIGSMFMQLNDKNGLETIQRIAVTVIFSIILSQLLINILVSVDLIDKSFRHLSLSGYTNNRNAFAMQLLCVMIMPLSNLKSSSKPFYNKDYWIISLLLVAIYFTFSRSGIITALILFSILSLIRLINIKQLVTIASQIAVIFICAFSTEKIIQIVLTLIFGSTSGANDIVFSDIYSLEKSNHYRFYTMTESLKLWSAHPFFGIGLGGFANYEFIKNGLSTVIHNSFIWILVEFGIIGSSIFFWYGSLILKYFYRLISNVKVELWSTQDKLLFNLCLVFGAMACVHEMIYQRILWFLFGVAIVIYKGLQPASREILSEAALPGAT